MELLRTEGGRDVPVSPYYYELSNRMDRWENGEKLVKAYWQSRWWVCLLLL